MNADPIVEMYLIGLSINQISDEVGISASTVYRRLKAGQVVRSASDSIKLAISQGRGAAKLAGRKKDMSPEWLAKLIAGANAAKAKKARGWRINTNGYVEVTTGEHSGRALHVITMEKRIGRKLLADEAVHHIDGDKQNNSENNLALMTRTGHSRLHRLQEKLSGCAREKDTAGKFTKEGLNL